MSQLRWIDKSQPQTLMSATILMYINSVFGIIDGMLSIPVGIVLVFGQVAAALGIANEKKWAYWLGVALVVGWLYFIVTHFGWADVLNIMIYGAMLALLLHPQSRNYRKVWFR